GGRADGSLGGDGSDRPPMERPIWEGDREARGAQGSGSCGGLLPGWEALGLRRRGRDYPVMGDGDGPASPPVASTVVAGTAARRFRIGLLLGRSDLGVRQPRLDHLLVGRQQRRRTAHPGHPVVEYWPPCSPGTCFRVGLFTRRQVLGLGRLGWDGSVLGGGYRETTTKLGRPPGIH